jgi:antitoxin FitA
MRSLVFEGRTCEAYEAMRQKDKKLHEAARKIIKELLRCDDPAVGIGKPESLTHNEQLKQAAKAHHRSVNSELIHCLEKTYKPTRLSAAEIAYRAGELRRRVAAKRLDIDEINVAKNQGRE